MRMIELRHANQHENLRVKIQTFGWAQLELKPMHAIKASMPDMEAIIYGTEPCSQYTW